MGLLNREGAEQCGEDEGGCYPPLPSMVGDSPSQDRRPQWQQGIRGLLGEAGSRMWPVAPATWPSAQGPLTTPHPGLFLRQTPLRKLQPLLDQSPGSAYL